MDEFTDGQDMTEDTEQIINDTEDFGSETESSELEQTPVPSSPAHEDTELEQNNNASDTVEQSSEPEPTIEASSECSDRCPDHDCCHCREVRYGTVQKTVWKSQFLSNTKHWTDGGEKSSPSFSMKGGYCETNKNTRACSSSLLLSGDYWNNWKLSDCTGG